MKTLIASALALLSGAVQAQTIADSTSWYLFEGNPAQVRQYVMEVGKGPTVVVIHGGYGAEHSYLLKPFLPLSGKHHLVFYDQRGSLRSPAGTHEVSLPKLVDDLEALRQELGQDKLVLLTHSMGATTAMAYLARYPDRVRGLVLTAPALPTDKERGTFDAPLDPALLDAGEQKLADARFARFWQEEAARVAKVKAALPPAPSGGAPAAGTYRQRSDQWRVDFAGVNLFHVERWREMEGGRGFYRQDVADAVLKDRKALLDLYAGFRPALQAFNGPVQVVIGDHDFIDPGAYLWAKVLQKVPKGQLTVLPEAGHNYWIDQPDLSVQALEKALARIDGAATP